MIQPCIILKHMSGSTFPQASCIEPLVVAGNPRQKACGCMCSTLAQASAASPVA